jgi:uncharacterized hydrophobic protein (TIGR00271 family)
MLHVRLVSAAASTERLADALAAAGGVCNIVVLAGAARRPTGDAVEFDVPDGAANPVFRLLRQHGLDSGGVICVQRVDAALASRLAAGTASADTAAADTAQADTAQADTMRADTAPTGPVRTGLPGRGHGALRPETAPVWELVEAGIRDGARYPPSFYMLLAIAGLIGAVGILTNSQILIVGAMVVGPEYNAIIGVALGLAGRDRRAVSDGLAALLWGFTAAVALTLLLGLAVRWTGRTPATFLAGVRPVAELINSPDEFSVIVALLAGVVGVVSLTEARANAMIGVFISVTTIPAAASVGISVAYASWADAAGSVVQLLLNVVLLIGVGAAGLATQRRFWQRHQEQRRREQPRQQQ